MPLPGFKGGVNQWGVLWDSAVLATGGPGPWVKLLLLGGLFYHLYNQVRGPTLPAVMCCAVLAAGASHPCHLSQRSARHCGKHRYPSFGQASITLLGQDKWLTNG